MAIARRCSFLLYCLSALLLHPQPACAQDMPAFKGKYVPLTEQPRISGTSRTFQCEWHRKSDLLRKDMYDRYPTMHREERISIAHNAGETIITQSGTGTFGEFTSKAVISGKDSIQFDTPPLTASAEKKLFLFGRAAAAVLGYWSIAERPTMQGTQSNMPAWRDPIFVSAVSAVVGQKMAEELLDLEVSGIDMVELSFVEETNAYLQQANRSIANHCTLNKRWAKEECVTNVLGWTLYDRDTGLVVEQDTMYTLLTGDGLSSRVAATWRERLTCQRVPGPQ